MREIEGLTANIFLLWDLMSDVPGFEKTASLIYEEALQRGVKQVNSREIKLSQHR
jgi:hypothetical protein